MNEYDSSLVGGAFAAFFGFILLFALLISVISIVAMWKLFEKAGKPGWASLIPIYNTLVMIEIVGKPTIWILWLLIPCTSPIFAIWLINLFVKSYGKDEAYTVGILLLPIVFLPLLAFGNNPYIGPTAAEARGSFNPANRFGTGDAFNKPPMPPEA